MSLLLELRAATREVHERLEQGLDVAARGRTREDYAALLAGLRSTYAPLERAVSAAPSTGRAVPDWSRRRKTGWLDDDLRELGRAVPRLDPVPALESAEDVVGAVYVMEGATLGGALVVRALRESSAEPPPHRFFISYGERRGAMWRRFRACVDDLETRGADADRVVEAARGTFVLFETRCAAALA